MMATTLSKRAACGRPSSSVIPGTKISRRSSWKYNPCLRGWTIKFWSSNHSCGKFLLFMMFTSAPVSTRARMEKVLSSKIISNHIFKLSGYSLDLDLLVWLTDFPFPVTLGQKALWRISEFSGVGLSFTRSAWAIDTERYGSWGFSASSPLRYRPPYSCCTLSLLASRWYAQVKNPWRNSLPSFSQHLHLLFRV